MNLFVFMSDCHDWPNDRNPCANKPRKHLCKRAKGRRRLYTRLLRMKEKHSSTPGSINLKQRCVIYCIYDHTGKTDHMYVGITHRSAMTRYCGHIAAARQWARRPAAAITVTL